MATPEQQQDSLIFHSGTMTREQLSQARARLAAGALDARVQQTWDRLRTSSVPTAEMTGLLCVSPATVRRRLHSGQIFGFRDGSAYRFPLWQFTDHGNLLPELPRLIAAINPTMHPAGVAGIMTNDKTGLRWLGRPVSPRDWLTAGGDITRILQILEEVPWN